jgi:hypothetical protein
LTERDSIFSIFLNRQARKEREDFSLRASRPSRLIHYQYP